MPIIANNFVPLSPGVYVSEDTFGAVPPKLASFNDTYMLGFSTKAGLSEYPIFLSSFDDYINVVGGTLSSNSVKLFFDQRAGVGLWFINVPPKDSYTITIPSVVVGTTYSVTIDGFVVSYTAIAGDTPTTALAKLADRINQLAIHSAFYYNGTIRTVAGLTVTASTGVTLGTKVVAGAYPVVGDVAHVIASKIDSQNKQGFLIAPEFFQNFSVAADRTALTLAMEALCADPLYNWEALVDCGTAAATAVTASGGVNLALAERNAVASPKGHASYYWPYIKNAAGVAVPASAGVAGLAIRRFKAEGYRQPPAGASFPMFGAIDTTFVVTDRIQGQLNPSNVNCIRLLPAGRGLVVYGARTLSANPYYKFLSTRIILSVLDGTLAKSFDDFIFSSVDGQGVLFGRIKQTCVEICENLRRAGALYGATPEDAYLVICDMTNNTSAGLESGIVYADIIVKPSPVMEALQIRVSRASLGTVLTDIIASGDTTPVPTLENLTAPLTP